MADDKKRHPLPASDEARHSEIPEPLEREKGAGDDDTAAVQPGSAPVNPDGEAYGDRDPRRDVERRGAAAERSGAKMR